MQDLARINALIDAAAKRCGGSDNKLAAELGTSRQVVSNWRHGHKAPSLEAQADLATVAGCSVPIVVLTAMFENASGARKARLQGVLNLWARDQKTIKSQTVPFDWEAAVNSVTPERTAELMAELEASKTQPGALVPATWRKKADVIKGRVKDVGKS